MTEQKDNICRFLRGQLNVAERKELEQWVHESEANTAYFQQCVQEFDAEEGGTFDSNRGYRRFRQTIQQKQRRKRIIRWRYAAALAGLILVGYGIIGYLAPRTATPIIASTDTGTLPPSPSAVTVRLADGTVQTLDRTAPGVVTDSAGQSVALADGTALHFTGEKNGAGATLQYHEVYVPLGETLLIMLPDSTKVWLNADTQLRFPTDFTQRMAQRQVYLTGEAYFEVTHRAVQPFVVNTEGVSVEVLGTRFNVAAYDADATVATTLVDGAVNVYQTDQPENTLRLLPNSQASYNKKRRSLTNVAVDARQYIGWIQNKLIINNLRFPEILARLERRHNVTIINHAHHLSAEVYQGEFEEEGIEAILEVMALENSFSYTIDGGTITLTK